MLSNALTTAQTTRQGNFCPVAPATMQLADLSDQMKIRDKYSTCDAFLRKRRVRD
jgi:hypothetical protein